MNTKMSPNKDYIVIDIGGSGTRVGVVTPHGIAGVRRENVNSVDELSAVITTRSRNIGGVALSIAGFVHSESGSVGLSRCAPWLEGNLRDMLAAKLPPGIPIHIVNDGEAHALALKNQPNLQLGAFNLSIGTSPGLGALDTSGNPYRAIDGGNWDIGDMLVKTSAPRPNAWWCLGEEGLEELINTHGKEKGLRRFGYRLGHFMTQLAIILRPRTVGLSGGIITRYWPHFKEGVNAEFNPSNMPTPDIIVQKDDEAALCGLITLFND